MKGFFEGVGGMLGFIDEGAVRPWKEANAEGVSDVASAGGGRPVTLAKRVRNQRRRVNMPRIEPRVLRRLENCSATDIIARRYVRAARPTEYVEENRIVLTKKTRMRSHISAFEHLRKPAKRPYDALYHLKRRLRVLIEAVGQAIGVVRIHASHHPRLAHSAVHAPHAAHATAHAAVHAAVARAVAASVH